jgi:hypothetical protein
MPLPKTYKRTPVLSHSKSGSNIISQYDISRRLENSFMASSADDLECLVLVTKCFRNNSLETNPMFGMKPMEHLDTSSCWVSAEILPKVIRHEFALTYSAIGKLVLVQYVINSYPNPKPNLWEP